MITQIYDYYVSSLVRSSERLGSGSKRICYLSNLVILTGFFFMSHAMGAQNTLQVVNKCTKTVWVQQQNMPAPNPQIVELNPNGGSYSYSVPVAGVQATRFWPKMGCDSKGNNCAIGQSSPPCNKNGCTPPIDSKLEVSFANPNLSGLPGQTFYNLSQVDGVTLPYNVTVSGGETSNCTNAGCPRLPNTCISNEDLTTNGKFPALADQDLTARDRSGSVVGCFSASSKLTFDKAYGAYNYPANDAKVGFYTCESVKPANQNPLPPYDSGAVLGCRAGPAPNTKWTKMIHSDCDGVYAYSYDDVVGTHSCVGETHLVLTFCPEP
ncbi:hypothetical protein AMST5_04207 [freshwater sediment metagenome]|uniref:Uncharacterized protein n=1 Tax=freshwater sediment metagenome TaxID=556182 RepID=A0AA48RFZ6_9ZZZZ